MSRTNETDLRRRLEELSAMLREAATSALAGHAAVASKIDDSRAELERLLMIETVDVVAAERAMRRAQLMLDAWRGMVGSVIAARSR